MNIEQVVINMCGQLTTNYKNRLPGILVYFIILSSVVTSCDTDHDGSHWVEDSDTIGQYIENNKDEFSKSYKLISEGKMLLTLKGYNPYGDDYTFFLPTDEAIDNFIEENDNYGSLEELIEDTSYLKTLVRYHTLNEKVHTNEFPDGALTVLSLTDDRLVTSFTTDGDNQVIKVNNEALIEDPNIELSNGYIHIVSAILAPIEITGYEWIQQQEGYSILASALELAKINDKLWFDEYTILAEHDSVYQKKGIMNIDDLTDLIATPGVAYSNKSNAFYKFAGLHVIGSGYYLNDLDWGSNSLWTVAYLQLTINVGDEIKINPGVDTYGIEVSEEGDTTEINYIRVLWDYSNIATQSGPIHNITDLLHFEAIP